MRNRCKPRGFGFSGRNGKVAQKTCVSPSAELSSRKNAAENDNFRVESSRVQASSGRGYTGHARFPNVERGGMSLVYNMYGLTGPTAAPGNRVEGWKRALDIVCIVVALPVLGPLALAVGIAIKLLSPGPALFRQERIGYRGKPFGCFKFRTMKVNADSAVHQQHLENLIRSNAPMVKMDSTGDERLIRFGRLFRATGLDELPQIINVLRGEMSLVGPRPCLPYEYEQYLPWHRRRFDTVPGLTGFWQVSGKNKTTFHEMVEMDIWYAKTKSLRLDLVIMFKTIPAILEQVKELIAKRKKQRQEGLALGSPKNGAENR